MAASLADLLKNFRSAARLSQEALAERAGLSARTIGDIETGFAKSPRLVSVMLIAEALGLDDAERSAFQTAARRRGAASAPSTLPQPERRLVGRARDVESVRALLEPQALGAASRLVTLVGPAGVGKTALALQAAFEISHALTLDGAVVELANVRDPELVAPTIAHALGIPERRTAARDALRDALRDRALLLVLDNFEHVLPAAPWVGEMLAACLGLRILATSREPLHLAAERTYAVRPLDAEAAAELFVARARDGKPGFALSAANRSAVAAIVTRLDCLPLAIELAAPRLSLLPPSALAARLDRRLPFLGDGHVDAPQRQQTMRGAIAWSYDLLAAEEQTLFSRLAILAGGASLDAAQAAAGLARPGDGSMLLRLASLVDKSLLTVDEDPSGEPRIGMLETLREFGCERLAESGDAPAVRERIARFARELARDAESHLTGNDQARWFERLERELPTMRAALRWSLDDGSPDVALAIAAPLWRFWFARGRLSEGRAWLQRSLDRCGDAVPDVDRARGLRALVVLLSALGEFRAAREPCERAIALQRIGGDARGLAASLTSLGIVEQFTANFDASERAHRESLAIRRGLGDDAGVASSLSNLASIAFVREDLATADAFARESVELYRKAENVSGLIHALTKLGLVAGARGAFESAERLFEECLHLQRALGITGNEMYSYVNLGTVALKRGRIEDALARYREALTLLAAVPSQAAAASALEGYAAAIAATGDHAGAARAFGSAAALRRRLETPHFPIERDGYAANVARSRAALGDLAFDAEWQIGATASTADAIRAAKAPVSAARLRPP